MSAVSSLPHDPRHSSQPGCPRCAYDLSGEVTRWTDQCPTTGICPECGLDVDWRDVLVRKYNYPEWFFETASTSRFRALRTTAFLALRPHRFWSRVLLNYPIDAKRAIVGGLGGFAWWYMWFTIASLVLSLPILAMSPGAPGPTWHFVLGWPFSWLWPRSGRLPTSGLSWWACIGLISLAFMPLAMLLMPISLRRVQIRPAHLLRITAYSTSSVAILMLAPFVIVHALALLVAGVDWIQPAAYKRPFRPFDLSDPYRAAVSLGTPAMSLALITWPVLWWWPACKLHLKLPRPLLISVVLAILCQLLLVTLTILIWGGFAYRRLFDAMGL